MQRAIHPKGEELSASGNIAAQNFDMYSDSECSQVIKSINWGTIMPGDSVTKEIHIKNKGNTPVTLNMTTADWKPKKADQQMTITWDKEGTTINPNEVATATLTLTVAENTTTIDSFSVTIKLNSST